jgi:hypothetical protein
MIDVDRPFRSQVPLDQNVRGIMQFFSSAAARKFDISELMPEPDRSRHDGLARYLNTGEPRIALDPDQHEILQLALT